MSEASDDKARTYLLDRRVRALSHDQTSAHFTVEGSADKPYNVRFNGFWTCDCPARKAACAHVLAVQYVSPHRNGTKGRLWAPSELDDLFVRKADSD